MFVQMQAIGKVEGDPELVITPVGIQFTEFPLAVNTKRCVEDITVWLTCQVWGELAETMQRSVTRGALLFVQGHFTPHPYTSDGQQEVSLEVTIEKFSFANESNPD